MMRAGWTVLAGAAACGCVATPAESPLVSDALHSRPELTLATAEGFIVGDMLGMSILGGHGVRLADVTEPFAFAD